MAFDIIAAIIISMVSMAIAVLATLFFGKKSFTELVTQAVTTAMQHHEVTYHRKIIEPFISEEMDKRIEKAISQHQSSCRVVAERPKFDSLDKRVHKVEKILSALYIKQGGSIEEINNI